jgi:endonuclease G
MKNMQSKFSLSFIILLTIFFDHTAKATVESVIGVPLNQNSNLALQAPETSEPEIILSREQYVLSYNKVRHTPNWVAWKLENQDIGSTGRTNSFAVDPDLSAYLLKTNSEYKAVIETDYKGTCYDRGHQIPSADRTDNVADNTMTFFMSNMIPQTAYLNRVIWEHLEQYSRNLVQKQAKKLYIVSGPIYDQNLGEIGPEKNILVPSKDFKIIYILNADQDYTSIDSNTETIAVIMPNILEDGSTPSSNIEAACPKLDTKIEDKADWQKYKTSIQEIEKLSGINFSTSVSKIQ